MSINLDAVARLRTNQEETEALILEALEEEKGFARAYAALSMRVWLIISQRHTAQHLRKLHNFINDLAVRAKRQDNLVMAGQFKTLRDQLDMSISMAEWPRTPEALKRANVPSILAALITAEKGQLSPEALRAQLGLQIASVVSLLNLLVVAGLVEAVTDHTAYRITREGRHAVSTFMPPAPKAAPFEAYDVTLAAGTDVGGFADGLRKASVEVISVIGMLNMITIRAMDHQVSALRTLQDVVHIEASVPVDLTPYKK